MKQSIIQKEMRRIAGKKRRGIFTGFQDVDEYLGGLRGGEITLVAAKKGIGTTSFLLSMAANFARNGCKTVVFPVTESEDAIVRRLLVQLAGDKGGHLLSGINCSEEELAKAKAAARQLQGLPVLIDDVSCNNVTSLLDSMLLNSEYLNAKAIVIDGGHLLSSDYTYTSRKEEMEAIFRQIKNTARFMDIPVILSVRLEDNETEDAENYRPKLSDLKQFGNIAELADNILLLEREEYWNKDTEAKGIMEVMIQKSVAHWSIPQEIPVAFIKEYMKCLPLQKA